VRSAFFIRDLGPRPGALPALIYSKVKGSAENCKSESVSDPESFGTKPRFVGGIKTSIYSTGALLMERFPCAISLTYRKSLAGTFSS